MNEPISTPLAAADAEVARLMNLVETQQATIAASDRAYQELQRILKEEGDTRVKRGERIFNIGILLEDFFRDGLDRCDDDDYIYFSLGHINELMDKCGFDPVSRVRLYNVGVTMTLNVDITVKASSEEEAKEMVEDSSFWLDTDGDFDTFEAPVYQQELDIYNISPAG